MAKKKYSKKKNNAQKKNEKILKILLVVLVVILIASLVGMVFWKKHHSTPESTDSMKSADEATLERVGVALPYELDDGKLIVNSVFQSSIENPDCNNEIGENVASVEVINNSGEFLKKADIEIQLESGDTLHICIESLPADATVYAFDTDNKSVEDVIGVKEITCKSSEYTSEDMLMTDMVQFVVDNTNVAVTNTSEEALTGLTVECHTQMDDIYFGGLTYKYDIGELASKETYNISADECYIGTAGVVNIVK